MRRLECSACRKSVDETDARWDHAFGSGACPFCGQLFDPARRAQSDALERGENFGRAVAVLRLKGSLFLSGALVLGILAVEVGMADARHLGGSSGNRP